MKLLLVDDIGGGRKLLREALEARGVTASEAEDRITALAILEREEFDAIIFDVFMPRVDSYRFCCEIRCHPRLRNLPIIAYTNTHVSQGDEQFALCIGADRYLLKTEPIDVLLRAVTELLSPNAVRRNETTLDDAFTLQADNSTLVRKLKAKNRELEERDKELKHVNSKLAESRTRFENIISSAMDAIITIDEGDCIVFLNAAAETMFGTSAVEILWKPLSHLLNGRFNAVQADQAGASRETGFAGRRMGVHGAISGRRADGTQFPIEASLSKTEVGGRQFFTVIMRDISERRRTEQQLGVANEQLRALAARTETVRERERTAIAREIHDVLAQDLTCLKIDLSLVAKKVAKPIDETARDAVAARIGSAIAQTDAAIATVQRIATDLRPVVLDSLGLSAAIDWQVEDFARRSGLTCHTWAPHQKSFVSRDCATAVFRILQESLTNVARHSCATEVDVEFLETASCTSLVISDNGCGITMEQVGAVRSIGLVGMRERAQAFGGTVEISGASDTGTTVRVKIPVDQGSSPVSR